MALTTLEKADTAAQVISDFSKKNDTGIGKVLKDTEASAVKEKITTAPDKTKSDAYVATIECTSLKIDYASYWLTLR